MRSTITRATQGLALNLAPLLAPYRRHGRLALRVERLLQGARFSRGSRNNDASWSLATDELDDLMYHPPEGARDHVLNVRIINLTGGNTLAVLEVPVSPAAAAPDEDTSANGAAVDAQVQALRQQLAQMKATLATRDAELADARQAAQSRPAEPEHDTEGEMEALRAELQSEFQERLAAVGAQGAVELKKQRDAWTAELNSRVTALGALTQQQIADARDAAQQEAKQTLAQAEATWKTEEAKRLAEAQSEWRAATDKAIAAAKAEASTANADRSNEVDTLRAELKREAQETLQKAEDAWKAAEAARLHAAEAQWRETSDKLLADLRNETASTRDKHHETALEELRTTLQREAAEALAEAQRQWSAEEAARLATAQAKWRAESDKALTEAKASRNTSESDVAKELRSQLATLQSTLAERDVALTEAGVTEAKMQRDARAALTKAQEQWKSEEDARLKASEAKWRAEADKALAEAKASKNKGEGEALKELRSQMAALQATLAERDMAVAKANASLTKAQGDAQDALAKAEKKWKADEAQRLAAAQKKWRSEADAVSAKAEPALGTASDDSALEEMQQRIQSLEEMLGEREAALAEAQDIIEKQAHGAHQKAKRGSKSLDAEWRAEAEAEWRASYDNALAEARARYEAAESALTQIRIKTKDGGRATQDLASARMALAAREKELAELRAKFTPLDGQGPEDGETVVVPTEAAPVAAKQQYSRAFLGSVIAAACLLALAIVFYPSIERAIYGAPPPPPTAAPEQKESTRLEPAAVEVKATLLRDAKLRAEASATSKAVATLTRGFEVIVLESKGKWTLVRMGDEKSPKGWVLQSILKEAPVDDDVDAGADAAPGK